MSWKGVELQVALPRVQEHSQLQDQLQQRGKQSQDFIGQNHLKEAEKMRKAVIKSEQKIKRKFIGMQMIATKSDNQTNITDL